MGSLEKPVFYFVLVVAVLNLIAYISVRDWTAILVFFLAGNLMHVVNPDKSIDLIVGILAATIFRHVYIEGMKTKPTPKDNIQELKEMMSGSNLEGLEQQTKKLVNRQKDLFHMANKMGPMMKQASEMMKQLPEGFLENAMKNFNKNNK
jgi:uncharacterized membrane protein (DUF106 family)